MQFQAPTITPYQGGQAQQYLQQSQAAHQGAAAQGVSTLTQAGSFLASLIPVIGPLISPLIKGIGSAGAQAVGPKPGVQPPMPPTQPPISAPLQQATQPQEPQSADDTTKFLMSLGSRASAQRSY